MAKETTCITATAGFGVSNQRLSRLRKGIQVETSDPTESCCSKASKELIVDVVLENNNSQNTVTYSVWYNFCVCCSQYVKVYETAKK